MISRLALLLALPLVLSATPAHAQDSPDLNRREALQHYRAGQEFLSSEQFEKAAEAFREAIDKDPLLALAHYGLGQSYMALKRYASAIVAFRPMMLSTMRREQFTSTWSKITECSISAL